MTLRKDIQKCSTYRSGVKGIKMSHNNKPLYQYAAIKCFFNILCNT